MTLANRVAFFLVCATIIFTTIAYGTVHQPVLALFYVIITITLIFWAVGELKSGTLSIDLDSIQLPLLLAAAYGIIQTLPFGLTDYAGLVTSQRTISLDPFATQMTVVHFIALAIFFAVALVVFNSVGRLKSFVIVIVVFGFGYAFFSILQSVLSPGKIYGIYEVQGGTNFGSFVNRHNFAAIMEMSIGLPLGMLLAGSVGKDKKLLVITAIILMGVALLLSGSRGGFVSILGTAIFLVAMTSKAGPGRGRFLRIVLGAALVLTMVLGAIFVGGESSLSRFAETAETGNFTSDRGYIWSVTLKLIANSMPWGVGFGAFGVAFTAVNDRGGVERVEQAHNDFLQVAADAGIPGILIGAFFLFCFVRLISRILNVKDPLLRGVALGAIGGCVGIMIHSLFDFVLHITAVSVMFIAMLAAAIACVRIDKTTKTEGRKRSAGYRDDKKGVVVVSDAW